MGSRIVDGEDVARQAGYATALAMRQALAVIRKVQPRVGTNTVTARIDAGRWVADCPYCAGSEVVSRTGKIFFCLSCGMAADGGRVRVVVFPADIVAVEALVSDLLPNQRFWTSS